MYTTKTGQKFGSAYVGKKKDAMHPEEKGEPMPFGQPKKATEPKAEGRTTPQGEAKFSKNEAHAEPNDVKGMNMEEGGQPNAKAVVAEHGKATAVHIKHDHVAHKHHVTSMHEDGTVHESDHDTPEEAHQEAATLGGEGEANAAENENGGMGEPSPMGDKMEGIFGGGQ